MSRTRHALPSHSHHYMKVQNRRKGEEAAIDDLKESGGYFRHANRLMNFWSIIPEPFDDKPCASWSEYHNKIVHSYPSQNDEHYTKRD